MSAEELLKEAQRKYPIGTVFEEVITLNYYTVESFDVNNKNDWSTNRHIIVWCNGIKGCGKYLYKNGVWAKKIKSNIYQIY